VNAFFSVEPRYLEDTHRVQPKQHDQQSTKAAEQEFSPQDKRPESGGGCAERDEHQREAEHKCQRTDEGSPARHTTIMSAADGAVADLNVAQRHTRNEGHVAGN